MSEEDDLEKLKEKVSEDLKIDRTDLKTELETNGNKYHRYLELLMDERRSMRKLKGMRNKLYRKLYHKFKFEFVAMAPQEGFVVTEREIQEWLEKQ